MIFRLTEKQIRILQKYREKMMEDEDYSRWYTDQMNSSKEIKRILSETGFHEDRDLSLRQLKEVAHQLLIGLGSAALKIAIGGKKHSMFKTNSLRLFNQKLRELLYSEDSLAIRVDNFLDLKFVGTQTVSQFLCKYDPKRFPFHGSYLMNVLELLLITKQQFLEAKQQALNELNIHSQYFKHDRTIEYLTNSVILSNIRKKLMLDDFLETQNLLFTISDMKEEDIARIEYVEEKIKSANIRENRIIRYDIPVWQMISEIIQDLPSTFRAIDVIREVKARRPQVKENTIRCHVISMAPDHPSSKWYRGKYKLFSFLGNGEYRLLPNKDIVIPSGYQRRETKKTKSLPTPKQIQTVNKLLTMGLYDQTIRECGSIIEKQLKVLYKEYFSEISTEKRQETIDFEKETGISIKKFTMGQWIGLFCKTDLIRIIAQDKGKKEFMFFNPNNLDLLNKLRNMATHDMKGAKQYLDRNSASLAYYLLQCILSELMD